MCQCQSTWRYRHRTIFRTKVQNITVARTLCVMGPTSRTQLIWTLTNAISINHQSPDDSRGHRSRRVCRRFDSARGTRHIRRRRFALQSHVNHNRSYYKWSWCTVGLNVEAPFWNLTAPYPRWNQLRSISLPDLAQSRTSRRFSAIFQRKTTA